MVGSGRISNSSVIVTCKNEEDQSKMKALECSHCKSMGIFSRRSRADFSAVHGLIRLNFAFNPDFIVVLPICKSEEDSIKNEGARVFITLYIDFYDAQRQLTP